MRFLRVVCRPLRAGLFHSQIPLHQFPYADAIRIGTERRDVKKTPRSPVPFAPGGCILFGGGSAAARIG
ncbi:MAG: hypothetical protein D3906_08575 [Candidatus Electrothrix sp. AUS1_2]|nr:hypothetical protein [Candidatus Electrothrix sp. AUS1_2]